MKEVQVVTVYSKNNCNQCEITKKVLTRDGVEFQEINMDNDPEALKFVTEELGYLAAPVVVTGSDHWSGLQPDKLKALVK